MYSSSTTLRVHYALTDQMGIVYHGHYAQFYEIGRTESIRELGFTYKDIEAMGVIMPVVDLHIRFLRPAKYDDLLTIKITLKELPVHHKVVFHGEIFNEQNELLNTGDVTLYFMEQQTMKRTTMPSKLIDKLAPFFKSQLING
jgi:acyl-CoA thioester hydrolase